MGKVLFVATVVKGHIAKFHIPYLKMFKDMGWETAVAAKNDYERPEECAIPYCDAYYDLPFERSPYKSANVRAYKELKKIINEGHYDIIHCHTPVGAALTRLAASDARKRGTKVFYTAHGFHFYKGAPLANWLLYYPVERWLAPKTNVLITINHEDYERAKTFKAGRVEYVPGVGIDIRKFQEEPKREPQTLRRELGIPLDATVLLSVGEVNRNKNHKVVVEALPDLPGAYYVICGEGSLMDDLRTLSQKLNVSGRFIMTGYRADVADFYQMADIFVFPSLREGLSVALMEAMANGLPVVCSDIRGNRDLIEHGKSGVLVGQKPEPKAIAEAVEKLRTNASLRARYAQEAARRVQCFDVSVVIEKMKTLYEISGNVPTSAKV